MYLTCSREMWYAYSGHVAIYIGNNKIVHASNSAAYPKGGIKTTSPADYRTILAVRRYW